MLLENHGKLPHLPEVGDTDAPAVRWRSVSAQSQPMLKGKFNVRCLGVGDGWPSADRRHSSFLYRLGKNTILIDCGDGASSGYKSTHLPCDLVDRIFISHLHSDHSAGFFILMQGFWLEQRKKELRVSLPADGIKPVSQMLEASYIYPELLPFQLRLEALHAAKPVAVGDARVTAFRTSHLDRLRKSFKKKYPQTFDAFSFLIEASGLRIGHSADLGRVEDLGPLVRQPLDLLVCELAHFRAEDLFTYLNGRNIKRVIFTHVARPYWQDLKNTRQLAAKMLTRIPFAFARDNDEFPLAQPTGR